MLLTYALCSTLLLATVKGEVFGFNAEDRIEYYVSRQRTEFLQTQLAAKCPGLFKQNNVFGKRVVELRDEMNFKNRILVEKQINEHLFQLLKVCQGKTTKTQAKTTQTWIDTTTQSSATTYSIDAVLPFQCTSPNTVNLTEFWRNNSTILTPNHNDMGILDGGRAWFRFTGAAGTRLRNTCPYQSSCGSTGAYWSDNQMPEKLGETKLFIVYESYFRIGTTSASKCKVRAFNATATRCSLSGDFVYRLDDSMSGGYDTLCGMD